MKTSFRLHGVLSIGLSLLLLNFISLANAQEIFQFVQPENRWGILIDTTPRDDSNAEYYKNALSEMRQTLMNTGIKEDHVIFYSFFEENPDFYPESKNIQTVINAFHNPNANRLKVPNGPDTSEMKRIRTVDGIAEVQLYIVAKGVANSEQTRSMLIPADIDSERIQSTEDKGLIDLANIEKAMIECEAGQLPVERTLFVVNFLSVQTVTRSPEKLSKLKDIELDRVAFRQAKANDEQEEEEDTNEGTTSTKHSFQHLRILTKNESMAEKTTESFYQILQSGLDGYADLSGNQDGVLQAVELSQYMEANSRSRRIQCAQNGNDPFPICRTSKQFYIPSELLQKVGDIFTLKEFSDERQSAYERAEQLKAAEKEMVIER